MRRPKNEVIDHAFVAFLTRHKAHGLLRERTSVGLEKWWTESRVATDLLWVADRAEVSVGYRLNAVLECVDLVSGFFPFGEPIFDQAHAMSWNWGMAGGPSNEDLNHMWELLWTRMHHYTEDQTELWTFSNYAECPWYRVGWVMLDVLSFLGYGFTTPVTSTGFAGTAVRGVVGVIEEDVRLNNITHSLPDLKFCQTHHIEPGSKAYHALASIGERAAVDPVFTKPSECWGTPPRMSEEAAAATEAGCADVVRYYIPFEVVESCVRGIISV